MIAAQNIFMDFALRIYIYSRVCAPALQISSSGTETEITNQGKKKKKNAKNPFLGFFSILSFEYIEFQFGIIFNKVYTERGFLFFKTFFFIWK